MNTIEKAKRDTSKLHRKVITNKLGHKQTVWVRHAVAHDKKERKKKEDFVKKISRFGLDTQSDNVMGYMRGGVTFNSEEMKDILPRSVYNHDKEWFGLKITRDGKITNWKGGVSVPGKATPKYIEIQGYQNDELWQMHLHGRSVVFEEQSYNRLFPTGDFGDDFVLKVETKTGKIVNWEKPSNEKLMDYFEGTGDYEGEAKDVYGQSFKKAISDTQIDEDVLVVRLK